ncbi:DUF5110 domain-containing protein [Parvularcula sp. ZS-1/3]|uniref:DUF5110 domain-containing protein n=1 Tax=Parvularcula mediterranea TaxID=2732508 RepID=A0A7Y3RK11_9PROT|nr:TIM-barrel domain-containing protein [Parvularcula mediterranea]NNU15451.1 DUF5110 domain-containing protein [Parvularcula mediterranea]
MSLRRLASTLAALALLVVIAACGDRKEPDALKPEITRTSVTLRGDDGRRLRLTAYGEAILRVQIAERDEEFLPDGHYQMVVSHDWDGELTLMEDMDHAYIFATSQVEARISKDSLEAAFFRPNDPVPLLAEAGPLSWSEGKIEVQFVPAETERFTGLGHGFYGRSPSIDLKGQKIRRNYGSEQIEQAPLIVPFFMSSKGYGLFLNSMLPNEFRFGFEGEFSIEIEDPNDRGQMDYFFIAGPDVPAMLDNYTQLTGRPRLPMKSVFGLQLSDKGHDHTSDTPSDEDWWKKKIEQHRAAGYPLDHVVNDNRWRAAGGKRCESKLAWDSGRYPDPASYKAWLDAQGLTLTLDFNRCIAKYTDGWEPAFNLPDPGSVDFADSAPDLTNPDFRRWFWSAFHDNALDPSLGFPGDALWIDEFDEQGAAPKGQVLHNGATSGEMRNYWFFLIAQALVAEGWDKAELESRPFVWVRGMTAGAQRYATLWSGDIYPNYDDMKGQVRAMQLAGLSGFPFWGHDAGGFFDWNEGVGPDEQLYQQWGMALGAFSPIWKPHGMGQSRWPLDRSDESQAAAAKFSRLRYALMPYTYTFAHVAAETGTPIIRPMMFDDLSSNEAWARDLQFMFGDSLLVAPQTDDSGTVEVWLPEGSWFDFFTGERRAGGQVLKINVAPSDLPVFVKAGSIIPTRDPAASTAFLDKSHLELTVYAGRDGAFTLVEDDDRTEAYRDGARRLTTVDFDDAAKTLSIVADGTFEGANLQRRYTICFVGVGEAARVFVDGEEMPASFEDGVLEVSVPMRRVDKPLRVSFG